MKMELMTKLGEEQVQGISDVNHLRTLSSHCFPSHKTIKIYKLLILPVVLYGSKT
jgi:hypothetical protein